MSGELEPPNLQEDPSVDAVVRRAWSQVHTVEAERLWRAFEQRLGDRSTVAVPSVAARMPVTTGGLHRARRIWQVTLGTIASVLLVIVGWQVATYRIETAIAGNTSTYTTMNGERATVTLPDGSTALLNVGSRLIVPSNYATGSRTVDLTGEALFTVKHHSETPFTVRAGASITRVLGTSFTVRHYANDSHAIIAVRDGRVAVGSTVLSANQQTSVDANGVGAVLPIVNPGQFSFERGILTLRSVRLADAAADLNRWYNVDLKLGNQALADLRMTGEYVPGSPANLVEILEGTFAVRVERNGNTLTLYSR